MDDLVKLLQEAIADQNWDKITEIKNLIDKPKEKKPRKKRTTKPKVVETSKVDSTPKNLFVDDLTDSIGPLYDTPPAKNPNKKKNRRPEFKSIATTCVRCGKKAEVDPSLIINSKFICNECCATPLG